MRTIAIAIFGAIAMLVASPVIRASSGPRVTILVYHRFGPVVADSMTVRTSTFAWQLGYLKDHGYTAVPLRTLVAFLRHEGPAPPSGSVVLTADDGHRSVFTDMWPIVRAQGVPVTLFIYPSAISNASYAMTWTQLAELRRSELIDIQSHTYWHPNFTVEKRRLAPDAYQAFVAMQLQKPRTVLKEKLGVTVDVVAWPFGLHDDELLASARDSGYVAGLTLDRRLTHPDDDLLALPRFLVTDSARGRAFEAMLPAEPR